MDASSPERAMEGRALLPGLELANCQDLAVPADVMQHVVRVESSYNPYAIGVVGGRLARQPRSLPEALATARMLERRGYNFSLGLAQVNRYNLDRYGLASYAQAFDACPNLQAGSRILAECNARAGGDWGKAFSCYYSGDFSTGYRHGYVQKIFASMRSWQREPGAIPVIDRRATVAKVSRHPSPSRHAAAAPHVDASIASTAPPPSQGAATRSDDAFVF
jgi:type IV secretion system protein VirB1